MSGTSLSSLFSFSWVSLEAPRQKQWQNRRVYPGLWMPQMKNKAGGKPRVHQEQCVSGANLEREERDKSTSLQVLFLISCWVVSDSLWPCGLQHTRLPCPSLYPGVCWKPCPLSRWCHPTISSSVTPFSSYPQSFPPLESFSMSWLFTSSGQSIRASASASILPMNIQGWFPLGLTGLISFLSKGLSRVFSSTRGWKHQFFGTQPSLWSNS